MFGNTTVFIPKYHALFRNVTADVERVVVFLPLGAAKIFAISLVDHPVLSPNIRSYLRRE